MTELRGIEGGENGSAALGQIYAIQEERIRSLQAALDEQDKREPLTLEDMLGRLQPDSDYKPVYKIRTVKTKDTKRLINMIRKVRNNERIFEAAKTLNTGHIANETFGVLLEELEEEFFPFLADLADLENLDEEPASAPFDILNDLMNDDGFLGALKSASRLVIAGKKLFGR